MLMFLHSSKKGTNLNNTREVLVWIVNINNIQKSHYFCELDSLGAFHGYVKTMHVIPVINLQFVTIINHYRNAVSCNFNIFRIY